MTHIQKELSEGDKDIVKENIVRESPDDKVKDLLEWMESIRKNIRHKVHEMLSTLMTDYMLFCNRCSFTVSCGCCGL